MVKSLGKALSDINKDIKSNKRKYPKAVIRVVKICRAGGSDGSRVYQFLTAHITKTAAGYYQKDTVASQINTLIIHGSIDIAGSVKEGNLKIKLTNPKVTLKKDLTPKKKEHHGWTSPLDKTLSDINKDIKSNKRKYPEAVVRVVKICRARGSDGSRVYQFLTEHITKTAAGNYRKDSVASQINSLVKNGSIDIRGRASKGNLKIKFTNPEVASKKKKYHGWTRIIYTPMK